MGAGEDDRFASVLERPRRQVRVPRPFALGRFPVSFAQWDAYCDASPGAWRPPDEGLGRGALPVTCVSWEDVQGYLVWLGRVHDRPFRLPSEAEWEYACRAGSDAPFATGHDISLEQANFGYSENGKRIGQGRPLPVGSYPANAFGLHDMHGTVCELVADSWHDGYAGLPADTTAWTDPAAPSVVCRGGAWDYPARLLRSAFRDWVGRGQRLDNLGFRVACTPAPG